MRHARLILPLMLLAGGVQAADTIVGTLTVAGKPSPLRYVYASLQRDPEQAERSWLVLLLTDVAVAEADQAPERLLALARARKLSAVRVLWLEGFDTVRAVPYHADIPHSGRQALEHPTLNLMRYDEQRFEGDVKSKMLAQEWHFQASVKAALRKRGQATIEPAIEDVENQQPAAGGDDKRANKLALAKLGYEYSPEHFAAALSDANVRAVELFLKIGISPNERVGQDEAPLARAVTGCAYGHESEALAMVKALLAAGAAVDGGSQNGITPLLDATQYCEGSEVVAVLLEAGAKVDTRAPGGATPLMFAQLRKKQDVEALLRKAGARD